MKLSEYVKSIREAFEGTDIFEISFDLGVEPNMEINEKSKNRVKFTINKR